MKIKIDEIEPGQAVTTTFCPFTWPGVNANECSAPVYGTNCPCLLHPGATGHWPLFISSFSPYGLVGLFAIPFVTPFALAISL